MILNECMMPFFTENECKCLFVHPGNLNRAVTCWGAVALFQIKALLLPGTISF